MAKKSGNLLIKVAVLIALVAAIFFALESWRRQSTAERAEDASEPGATKPALSRAEAERIGTEIGTRIGREVGTRIGREVAAQMLAERQAQLQTAGAPEPEPAPAPPTEEVVSAEPPEPAGIEPPVPPEADAPPVAEAETPKKGPGHAVGEGKIPGTPVAQPAAGRDPWWIKSNTGEADALALTYAGNFKSSDGSQTGIALMFSGRFDKQTDFGGSISVTGGGDISGKWQLGANSGLIFLPDVPAGSYTVSVKAGLRDADGKTLKTDVSGTVEVK